ncbi:MAG: PilX N-terminal domain-containing pilus assembly protein [Candidatus Methylomirabilales bacterium]
MNGKRERKRAPGRGEGGVVLVTAMLVMIILSLLGATFLAVSGTERIIASNEMNTSRAFGIAEAGLEHARRELVDVGVNTILATCTGDPCIAPIEFTIGGQNVGFAGGTYNATVRDDGTNPDPNVVIVRATGTYVNAERIIEATVDIPQMPNSPGGVGAFGPEATVEVGGSAEVNGHNFNPDTGILDPSVASIPGVTFNSNDSELKLKKNGLVDGSTGAAPHLDTTLISTEWRDFADLVTPFADFTFTGPATISGTETWGTPSNPAITVISGPANETVHLSGTVTGAGILIVSARVEITGSFIFQGLVIIADDTAKGKKGKYKIELKSTGVYGEGTIYGGLILASELTNEIEYKFKLKGNSRVRYSREAIDRARKTLPTTIANWREDPS